jgi:hypothetical protein
MGVGEMAWFSYAVTMAQRREICRCMSCSTITMQVYESRGVPPCCSG